MQRTATLVFVSILVAAPAAAQTVDVKPGLIGPDSPVYGLDIAPDNVLKPPGERAHERASEALVAAEAGNDAARDRALTALNDTAAQAKGCAMARAWRTPSKSCRTYRTGCRNRRSPASRRRSTTICVFVFVPASDVAVPKSVGRSARVASLCPRTVLHRSNPFSRSRRRVCRPSGSGPQTDD